jgi:hypothetical protein
LRWGLREQRQGHRAHLVDVDVGNKRFRTLRQQNADTIAALSSNVGLTTFRLGPSPPMPNGKFIPETITSNIPSRRAASPQSVKAY